MGFLQARKKAGLSQAAVAKAVGVKPATVSYWDTGKTYPRAKTLRAVAELYGCSTDELMKEEE